MIIKQLRIYTSQLQEQSEFYEKVLGLTLTNKTENSVDFKIGYSIFTLSQKDSATPYHFAINIPENKDREALVWLKQRVPVLKDDDTELIDFSNWNAKAMYFYDCDKNIVELIARRNLNIETDVPFNQNQFLGISEIGLSVENIEDTFKQIRAINNVNIFDGNFDRFCAVGDEQGLFIIIDKNKKRWFPCDDVAYTSDFEIYGDFNFQFRNGQIKKSQIGAN